MFEVVRPLDVDDLEAVVVLEGLLEGFVHKTAFEFFFDGATETFFDNLERSLAGAETRDAGLLEEGLHKLITLGGDHIIGDFHFESCLALGLFLNRDIHKDGPGSHRRGAETEVKSGNVK